MEKCTIIRQAIISKANGRTTKNKVKEPWTGPISDKSMLVSGKTTIRKAGACISGLSPKVKENTFETDTKDLGWTVSDKDMEYFTMRMAPDMKAIGKTTWKKISHFIRMKMARLNWFSSKKTEWSDKTIRPIFRSQVVKKPHRKRKSNQIFTHYAWKSTPFTILTLRISNFSTIIFWEVTLP